MQKGIDEIPQNRFSVVVLIPTSKLKYRTKYLLWSNDADDSLFKQIIVKIHQKIHVVLYLKPDQHPTDKYNYYCRLFLLGYTTQTPDPADSKLCTIQI